MTKAIKNRILNIESPERKIFWYLVLFAIVLSGLYVYFVNSAIINGVEYQKIGKEIISLNSQISDLESSYLSLNDKISLDHALGAGFVKITSEKYVFRKAFSANLSLNQL